MKRLTFMAIGSVLFLGAACSSGSDGHAPALGDGGASPEAGAGGAQAGKSSAGSAGRQGGASSGGATGEAGDSSDGGADPGNPGGAGGEPEGMIIPVLPSACSESADWRATVPLVGVSTNATERLLSITADELDVVFVRSNTLLRAHRDSATASFGSGNAINVPAGYTMSDGAALSADGKTLVLVGTDGQSFGALTRTARNVAFGSTADAAPFSAIAARAVQTMEHLAYPVLSPDGKSLVFVGYTPEPVGGFPDGVEGTSIVYESTLAADVWAMPNNLSHDIFDGTTAARPLPSALSIDSRTLFYFDEATNKQVARFRDRPDAPLYTAVDVGARVGASPNASCDVVYYTSGGNVLLDSK
jgi:hypothetical protein